MTPWTTQSLIALDTETTGKDPETARLVQVAFVRSERYGHVETLLDTLVQCDDIPAEATAVHGITAEQTKAGMTMPDALGSIARILELAFADGIPIVGHNLAYDLTVIDREMGREYGRGIDDVPLCLDTLVLYRRFDYTTGSRRLEDLAKRNGITFPAHDALADSVAALKLLHILAEQNDLLPLVSPVDLHQLQIGWYEAQQQAGHWKRRGLGQASDLPNTAWPIIPAREEVAS